MEHKISRIPTLIVFLILIALIVISTCILLFTSKSTKVEVKSSHAELYELYTLDSFSDGKPRLTLYNTYKVKPENIHTATSYGNIITTYNTTDGTQIIFADNNVTVISPKDYKESFTQGYMKITKKVLVKAIWEEK